MIQRIQSIWLFLAALTMFTLFYFPIYSFPSNEILTMKLGNDYLGILLAGISIALSLFILFSFKNRKRQLSLLWLNILAAVALLGWLFFEINQQPKDLDGRFSIGAFIPLIVILFLFLARAGISKDEKLIKSLNRLR